MPRPRLLHLTLVLLALAGIRAATAAQAPETAPTACAADENLEPLGGGCAKVRDRRAAPGTGAAAALPSLTELRAKAGRDHGAPQRPGVRVPPPGGLGAGVEYDVGKLRTLRQGELYTRMIVQPDGLRETTGGLDWLFTTSTNHVERGVEVVAIYPRWDPEGGSLGIFDWSCRDTDPCPGGATSPSWVWVHELAEDWARCDIGQSADASGHVHRTVYYANVSKQLDKAATPLWTNRVLLWNGCDKAWDLLYEHRYRAQQLDCSPQNACAWWGPIFETFESTSGEPYPEIRELGFLQSRLLHDGTWSDLGPDETGFVAPASPWQLYHVVPNGTYGAGNFVTGAVGFAVKPGTTRPCVAPGSHAVVEAALLSAKGFRPTNVDPASVKVGRNGVAPVGYRLADVNRDGKPDFVLSFRPDATGLVPGDTTLGVLARTQLGRDLGGVATVRARRCG